MLEPSASAPMIAIWDVCHVNYCITIITVCQVFLCYTFSAMKYLTLAMLLAVMQAAPPVPRKTADSPAPASQHIEHNGKNKKKPPATPTVENSQEADTGQRQDQEEASHNEKQAVTVSEWPSVSVSKDAWDKTYIVLTAALVAIGCFTFIAIWIQAIETRKAAQAALLNAQSLINAERPWIVPIPLLEHPPRVTFVGGYEPSKHEPNPFSFGMTFKNFGRTPARIVSVIDIPLTLKPGESLPDIPNYAANPSPTFRGDRMLVPDDRWNHGGGEITAILTTEQFAAVDTGKQTFVYFGRIEYRDFLRPEVLHESRFCYFYRSELGEFVPDGPPEYNKYA
jgi:hypothetical protein